MSESKILYRLKSSITEAQLRRWGIYNESRHSELRMGPFPLSNIRLLTGDTGPDVVVDALRYGLPLDFFERVPVEVPAPAPAVPTLEQRIAAIEKRENDLAVLYRELSEIELERNHRAAIVRAMPSELRSRVSAFSGRVIVSRTRPLLREDPQYRALVQRWEGVMDSIRRIRSTPLSSPANS